MDALFVEALVAAFSNWGPQPADFTSSGLDERPGHLAGCGHAVAVARQHLDPWSLAWALQRLYAAHRELSQWQEGAAAAGESVVLLDSLTRAASTDEIPLPFRSAGLGLRPGVDATAVTASLAVYMHRSAGNAARQLGDLEGWRQHAYRARQYAEEQPQMPFAVRSHAIAGVTAIARALGDRDTFRQIEADLSAEAAAHPEDMERRLAVLRARGYNASAVKDFAKFAEMSRQRFFTVLGDHPLAPKYPDRADLAAWSAVLEDLLEHGDRDRYNTAANCAYDCAGALYNSGATQTLSAHEEAVAWLDLAELTWRSWARNGLWAVRSLRARLAATHPVYADPTGQVEELVYVGANALNIPLRINSLRAAVEFAEPGDHAVSAALEWLAPKTAGPDRGRVLCAQARWSARAAASATGDSSAEWQQALERGTEAVELLLAGARHQHPEQALQAWVSIADARQALRDPPDQRRHALRQAVLCVAQLLIDASAISHRERLAKEHAPLLRTALQEATSDADVATVDLVAEAVRRDSLGPLLLSLAQEPTATPMSTAAVEWLSATSTVVPEDLIARARHRDGAIAAGEPDEFDPEAPDVDRLRAQASLMLERDRRRAVEMADRELGVVAALADLAELPRARPARILQARPRHRGQVTALLQWLPDSLALLAAEPAHPDLRLTRRLTILDRSGEITHEAVDQVPLPRKLLPGPLSHGAGTWLNAHPLLPPALLEHLADHGGDDPLRLLLVPSGLFHLHVDALLIDDHRSLLDAAEVTQHTSLTGMRYQLRLPLPRTGRAGAQVYDTAALPACLSEQVALEVHYPPGIVIECRDDLRRLSDSVLDHAVLGVGLHGQDDEDEGWAQSKQLPDGTHLTAAEVFGYRVPPLVVLASCHSRLHTRRGIDLAGFPLALFARGARTVIGGVSTLSDTATGQIMQRFFDQLGGGATPPAALRQARLAWLADQPSRRHSPDLWGRLTTYGSTHA